MARGDKKVAKGIVSIRNKKDRSFEFSKILAIISIIGFLEIILDSMFGIIVNSYMGSIWLLLMGVGFILASKPVKLFKSAKENLGANVFSSMTTFIVGLIAFIAGVLALPQFNLTNPTFLATKGIISIISILFIIIETWILKDK